MTDFSLSKSQLAPRQIAALIIAAVFALLNVVSLLTWFGQGGQVFYEGDFVSSLVNTAWFLAPFGYIGAAVLVLIRKPNIGVWFLILPAFSVLSNIVYGLMNGFADQVIPLFSLLSFSPDYWAGNILSGTEIFAVVAIAILLLGKQKESRGNSTMSSNAPISKSNFCPTCGSAAGEGDFCSKCGTNLSNGVGTVPVSSALSGTTTSTMAVVAFILSFFVPIVGLILGYISRKDIDQSGGRLTGRGFATAAIILNWIWIAFIVIWIIGAVSFASQF